MLLLFKVCEVEWKRGGEGYLIRSRILRIEDDQDVLSHSPHGVPVGGGGVEAAHGTRGIPPI